MGANTSASGRKERLMGMVRCSTLMEMCTKENGTKTRHMVMANTLDLMEPSMKAVG